MSGATVLGILLAHLVGDYVLQSHWMALRKLTSWRVAWLHGLLYAVPYLAVTRSPLALLIIGGTHAVIDRKRLAAYVIDAKDRLLAPPSMRDSTSSGGLRTALVIIVDNTIHLVINAAAIVWL